MKTAILVDGGFYRKRASYLWGKKTAEKRAAELIAYCQAHLKYEQQYDGERGLYRIFYCIVLRVEFQVRRYDGSHYVIRKILVVAECRGHFPYGYICNSSSSCHVHQILSSDSAKIRNVYEMTNICFFLTNYCISYGIIFVRFDARTENQYKKQYE